MEKTEFGTLPPEVWSNILTFLDDINDLIDLKFVNRLFYHELSTRDPFAAISSEIKISKEDKIYLTNRDTTYSLPRESLIQLVQNNSINNGAFNFKTIFLGVEGVGKTSFVNTYVRGYYDKWPEITIAPSFLAKKLVDPDGITSKFEFWDTAGQERYRHLAPMYYRGARAVFLCFSIDDKQSLISLINKFVPDLCKAFKAKGPEDQPVMYLLGLKSDLEHNRQVSAKEARVLARALKMKYFECSAKLTKNMNEVMESLKDDLLKAMRVPGFTPPTPVAPPIAASTNQGRLCSIQ